MKAKWLVIGIAAVLTVGLSTTVWAQWCGEALLKLGQGCDAQQGTGQGWMARLRDARPGVWRVGGVLPSYSGQMQAGG